MEWNTIQLRLRATVAAVVMGLALVASSQAPAVAGETEMALRLTEPVASWGDVALKDKILDRLSGANGLRVNVIDDAAWETAADGSAFFDVRAVSDYGMEAGARYVVDISNLRADLTVRKGLSITLVLSRYSAVAAISGTLRIVDSERGRLVHQEDFEITKRARSDWQVFESNPHSGNLQVPASEKPMLLEAVEWRTADELSRTILKKLKLR